MVGIICSIIAGAVMSIQGVFNTRLSDKIGVYEANAFVQGTAFLVGLVAMFLFGRGSLREIGSVKWYYLLGGLLGFVITLTVIYSIKGLSPTTAISIILITQLLVAAAIDYFGLFDTEKMPFGWQKIAGLALMLAGIILFKWKISPSVK